jgi:cyclophilin family peptidyl-prolyl cis-trans isomerase
MIATSLALALLAQPSCSFPTIQLPGDPFVAKVVVVADAQGEVDAALLEPAGFAIAGKPLGAPLNAAKLKLPPGTRLAVEVDLAAALLSAGLEGDFELDWLGDPAGAQKVRRIEAFETSDSFLDEAKFTTADLAQFRVLMVTNQGPMEVEFWPEVAPNMVRNWLELCRTGFYAGTLFHRVGPGFMIQGGDPKTKELKLRNEWGTGSGPRKLVEELSSVKKHERGVLSMASGGPKTNTASSQFFVMHGPNPGLDGKYTCFGRLVSGFDALDKIATANGTPLPDRATFRPTEPQRIEKAILTMVKKG